jgi:hypothetical protein
MIDYVKISLVSVFLLGAFAAGWALRNRDFNDYKKEIATAAKAQEAKVESIRSQQELVTKGIQNEYDAKLALLRQYYANGVRQPNTGSVSNLSNTTKLFDANTAYSELIGQCAQTTQQLVSLQEWTKEQLGLK